MGFPTLPKNWGVLYLLYVSEGNTFKGKFKLQKALAVLQMWGVPIENIFEKGMYGHFDRKLDRDNFLLEREGYIESSVVPYYEYEMTTYKLTENGKRYVEQTIIPALKEQNKGEDAQKLFKNIELLSSSVSASQLRDAIHNEMYLDDDNLYRQALESCIESLKGLFTQWEQNEAIWCEVVLDVLGMTEFIIRALERIRTHHMDDLRMGRYNILYVAREYAKKLWNITSSKSYPMERCIENGECQLIDGCGAHELTMLYRAIAYNSTLYEILPSPDSDEFYLDCYLTDEEKNNVYGMSMP